MSAVTQQAHNNSAIPLTDLSFHSQWAALSIRENLAKVQFKAKAVPTESVDIHHLVPIAGIRPSPDNISNITGFKVGIVGAGAAGLFTAMLFDYLNDKYPGLNVQYEILEAEPERVGGRLFTYKFPKRPEQPKIGPHDYYDVGAMRFPEVKTMNRTYALFGLLGMRLADDPTRPKAGDLIPYYFTGPNQPTLYNGIQVVQKDGFPALSAKTFQVPNLPPIAQDTAAGALIDDRIQWLKTLYESNAEVFWKTLKKEVDPYSVRQYFTTQMQPPLDYKTLEFCETLNFGNRWYDQAASELVLESLDFNEKADWYCIEGGAAEIAMKMRNSIKDEKAIKLGKVVKKISYHKRDKDAIDVNVTVDGESTPRSYDAVFNSAPLGAMQHMHLEGLNLSWGVKSAIRSLGYGASCKVGIRFKSLWWISKLNITQGGQGKTDLPIRCCVYPSYNINDPKDEPGVLLVSYTWSQEAERIGALIDRKSPENENELRNLLFHDLARLHSPTGDDAKYQELYDLIESEYLDHYAYNWYNNPRTVGAFAWFGPGQFNGWYNDLTQSDGKYIMIGEAASAHHAWVVGSLESAVRGVYQFLWKNSGKSKAAKAATRDYNKGNIPTPFGPLPAEYSRTDDIQNPEDVDLDEDDLPSTTGDLARWQVALESLRQRQQKDVLDPTEITRSQLGSFSDILFKG